MEDKAKQFRDKLKEMNDKVTYEDVMEETKEALVKIEKRIKNRKKDKGRDV